MNKKLPIDCDYAKQEVFITAEFIEEGETVKQGQTIATVGNTATFEIADESHLHFEILKDNVQVDPELYLK